MLQKNDWTNSTLWMAHFQETEQTYSFLQKPKFHLPCEINGTQISRVFSETVSITMEYSNVPTLSPKEFYVMPILVTITPSVSRSSALQHL